MFDVAKGEYELSELPTIKVDCIRYKQLISAETELELLKKALSTVDGYSNIDTIKKIFDI